MTTLAPKVCAPSSRSPAEKSRKLRPPIPKFRAPSDAARFDKSVSSSDSQRSSWVFFRLRSPSSIAQVNGSEYEIEAAPPRRARPMLSPTTSLPHDRDWIRTMRRREPAPDRHLRHSISHPTPPTKHRARAARPASTLRPPRAASFAHLRFDIFSRSVAGNGRSRERGLCRQIGAGM